VWFQACNDSMPGTSPFALPIGLTLGFTLGFRLGFRFQACSDSMLCTSPFAVCVIYLCEVYFSSDICVYILTYKDRC